MLKAAFGFLVIACLMVPVVSAGQTPDPSQSADPAPAPPLTVTAKEVRAVEEALVSRGYLNKKPSGVLDAKTRQGLKDFQKDQSIEETGRIDQPTIDRLGLVFPLTPDGKNGERPNGLLPKIGYAIKDEATAGGKAIGGAAKKVGGGAKAGAEKTADVTTDAVGKAGETLQQAGVKSVDGAKTAGREVKETSTDVAQAAIGRSDADIHSDVRKILNADEKTRRLVTEVKEGRVTITTDTGMEVELGPPISQIRKVSGVKSVTVLNK